MTDIVVIDDCTEGRAAALSGRVVRISGVASSADDVALKLETRQFLPRDGECIVEVKAAGINMSDVKAALGAMPYAVWPRTPGRDYAGIVVGGPSSLVGKEVWGSSGELGIKKDGSLARYLVVSASEISEKPRNISLDEAGAIGVPFVTAFDGLRCAGGVKPDDVVLVLGGNGKVGQAVVQLATMNGARVFAVEREREAYLGHSTGPFDMIDASTQGIADYVRGATDGHGADIVFNTVGSPYFEQACAAMAARGRQIFISTFDRNVPFDIFRFFRGRHAFFGIDSLALSGREGAEILNELRPGFESGKLRPFPVHEKAVFALENAKEAFKATWEGSRDRIVIRP
jgi:NADPH:quinone reductase-like Zn-dependent oxidoreductase